MLIIPPSLPPYRRHPLPSILCKSSPVFRVEVKSIKMLLVLLGGKVAREGGRGGGREGGGKKKKMKSAGKGMKMGVILRLTRWRMPLRERDGEGREGGREGGRATYRPT